MKDSQIIELAKSCGIVTGENLRRGDDYLFRSLGTPTNVFGSHLVEFARAVRAWSEPSQTPCAGCEHPTLCADFPGQHRNCPATHAAEIGRSTQGGK
jgi:hypothetical protein